MSFRSCPGEEPDAERAHYRRQIGPSRLGRPAQNLRYLARSYRPSVSAEMITAKLWPELGDLFEDGDEA